MARRPKNPLPEHPLFPRFWSAYPRHTAKFDASQAFSKLNPDEVMLGVILAAIEVQKRSGCLQDRHAPDGGSVIPYPASWLRAHRWEDEEDAPAKSRVDRTTDYASATLVDALTSNGVIHAGVQRSAATPPATRRIGNGTGGNRISESIVREAGVIRWDDLN
jgi:hypothetical protein